MIVKRNKWTVPVDIWPSVRTGVSNSNWQINRRAIFYRKKCLKGYRFCGPQFFNNLTKASIKFKMTLYLHQLDHKLQIMTLNYLNKQKSNWKSYIFSMIRADRKNTYSGPQVWHPCVRQLNYIATSRCRYNSIGKSWKARLSL